MAIIDISYLRDASTGQVLLDANGYPQLNAAANVNANTTLALQQRVQNEVLGSPQVSDVQNAIVDAIGMFERDTFWFNTLRFFGGTAGSLVDLQTAAGKEFYSDVDLPILLNMPHIRFITVLAFNNRYQLVQRTEAWIDEQSVSQSWQGLPTDWAHADNGGIRIFPIPNGIYPLILNGTLRFPAPAFGADYSPWSNRAERLIRQAAKMLLFRDIIRDEPQAQICERAVFGDPSRPGLPGELGRLKAETTRRSGGLGRIRASRGYL